MGKVGDDGTWFDTTAFARPTGVRFGTVGRNTMRGPGVVNADLSLFRTFKVTEKINLQFRGESFNLSNTPHFANPERQREQLELRADYLHAVRRGCHRSIARNALWIAARILTRLGFGATMCVSAGRLYGKLGWRLEQTTTAAKATV